MSTLPVNTVAVKSEASLVALGEDIGTADFRLGEAVGLEAASTHVLEMSKAEFVAGNDKRAFELRDLSRLLKDKAQLCRSENQQFLRIRSEAFAELSRRDEEKNLKT